MYEHETDKIQYKSTFYQSFINKKIMNNRYNNDIDWKMTNKQYGGE